ncbi:MAG: pyridoxamine 5'-phosphate oxidase [Bacteroidia bacterium]|nr:pyridoxamine 5'-phosphate oxidase [Bacteroidia bacterium]
MSLGKSVADIRKDYLQGSLVENEVSTDPINQFEAWFEAAVNSKVNEPNAMSLATVKNGRPSLRIVLLKGFDKDGFVFFTNYESKKSREMEENPHVALTFFWPELERQIRIEGKVEKISEKDSDKYYQSRGRLSRLGAWASPQSSKISNREFLEKRVEEVTQKFEGQEVFPKPEFWGGFAVKPDYFEFWQGRQSRLHDRIIYEWVDGNWQISRLAP